MRSKLLVPSLIVALVLIAILFYRGSGISGKVVRSGQLQTSFNQEPGEEEKDEDDDESDDPLTEGQDPEQKVAEKDNVENDAKDSADPEQETDTDAKANGGSKIEKTPSDWKYDLRFLPLRNSTHTPDGVGNCEEYFTSETPVWKFRMESSEFLIEFAEFMKNIEKVSKSGFAEGFSDDLTMRMLQYLSRQKHVKNVCETGFNYGHSSFSFLMSNKNLVVHSFDLGNHWYAKKMAAYLTEKFPNRFFIHFGDSTKTVPKFIKENPNHRCDILYVDGGHTYGVAMADLTNFASIATKYQNIVVFDNWPAVQPVFKSIGVAWRKVISLDVLIEIVACRYSGGKKGGFSLGRVL